MDRRTARQMLQRRRIELQRLSQRMALARHAEDIQPQRLESLDLLTDSGTTNHQLPPDLLTE